MKERPFKMSRFKFSVKLLAGILLSLLASANTYQDYENYGYSYGNGYNEDGYDDHGMYSEEANDYEAFYNQGFNEDELNFVSLDREDMAQEQESRVQNKREKATKDEAECPLEGECNAAEMDTKESPAVDKEPSNGEKECLAANFKAKVVKKPAAKPKAHGKLKKIPVKDTYLDTPEFILVPYPRD